MNEGASILKWAQTSEWSYEAVTAVKSLGLSGSQRAQGRMITVLFCSLPCTQDDLLLPSVAATAAAGVSTTTAASTAVTTTAAGVAPAPTAGAATAVAAIPTAAVAAIAAAVGTAAARATIGSVAAISSAVVTATRNHNRLAEVQWWTVRGISSRTHPAS